MKALRAALHEGGRPKLVSGAPVAEPVLTPEQEHQTFVEIHTPAKMNFTLALGGNLDDADGSSALPHRHGRAFDTLYCSVGLYDDVELTLKPHRSGFSLDLEGANLGDLAHDSSDLRDNSAIQALFLLAEHARREPDVGIRIFKRIPVAAGLGSAPADAAAVLVGLNHLWKLGYSIDELRALGAQIGPTVPFCITGGLLHGSGHGEIVEPVTAGMVKQLSPALNFTTILLGTYNQGLSADAVYAEFDRQNAPLGAPAPLDPDNIPFGSNDLEEAVCTLYPRSGAALNDAVNAADGVSAFVCGTGPTVVACLPDSKAMWKVIGAWKASRNVDRIVRVEAPAELTLL